MNTKFLGINVVAVLIFVGCGIEGDVLEADLNSDFVAAQNESGEPVRPVKADSPYGSDSAVGEIDGFNDPSLLGGSYERRYEALPLSGQADRKPWTGSYWPKHKGGIGYRWQTNQSHTYESPTREEALAMTPEEIANLSPAEKYDLLVGNYDYPLTLRAKAENSAKEATWTGYCHGWTQAAIHFDEPSPVTMSNPDGIEIAFGSSDIKALLTYFQGDVVRTTWSADSVPFKRDTRAIGSLCNSNNPESPSCTDTNPGAFHIVMANVLGMNRQAFGIDATTTYEKWNHPVHTYQTQELFRRLPSAGASRSAVVEVGVVSSVTYTIEIEPQWEEAGNAPHADKNKQYAYTLELDAAGTIVGGQWLLLMDNGGNMTLTEVIDYFKTLDENGDGQPDLSLGDAHAQVWKYFDFPDYVWLQDEGEFSPEFKQAYSGYAFIATNLSTRLELYAYLAELGTLYEASTRP